MLSVGNYLLFQTLEADLFYPKHVTDKRVLPPASLFGQGLRPGGIIEGLRRPTAQRNTPQTQQKVSYSSGQIQQPLSRISQ